MIIKHITQMEQQVLPDSDDELKARNEALKLKLALEHGMKSYQCDGLNPELENQWLNYIYRHEQLHQECGRVTVYEYLGCPAFTAVENLERKQVSAELERLLAVMRTYGVQLDCICEYDDTVIYRFLTTELFAEEMDNIHMPGLVNHFTYEDFHMNNQYELERIGVDLIKSIYNHEWRAEYDSIWVGSAVKCNGVDHDFHGFSSVILGFQQRHSFLEIRELNINEVSVDETNGRGELTASLAYMSQLQEQQQLIIEGDCSIAYKKDSESGHWHVIGIKMPGIY
jgi:hypothetical protein